MVEEVTVLRRIVNKHARDIQIMFKVSKHRVA